MIRAIHLAALVFVLAGITVGEYPRLQSVGPAGSNPMTFILRGEVVTADGMSVPNARAG